MKTTCTALAALTLSFTFVACSGGTPDDCTGSACNVDGTGDGDGTGGDGDDDSGGDDGDGAPQEGCRALPKTEGTRYLVISRPYDASANQASTYEVFAVDAYGTLSRPGTTFSMRRNTGGVIAFTPDGELGFAPQNDGTVGVFRLDAAGNVEVLDPAYVGAGTSSDPEFYAAKVLMHPSGAYLYVLDTQVRANGGGVYRVRIGCDDTLTSEGRVLDANLPGALAFVPASTRVVLAGGDVVTGGAGSPTGEDVHLFDLEGATARLGGLDALGEDEGFISDAAVTATGQHVIVSQNNEFTENNRLVVLGLGASGFTALQDLAIGDPMHVVLSPFGNGGIVIDGYGDAIHRLSYDASSTSAPFGVVGELSYSGAAPQLPDGVSMIQAGSLRGRVFISEVGGIRQVRMTSNTIADMGAFALGDGYENMPGAIGVQP